MPTSPSLNVHDPVQANRNTKKSIFRMFGRKSPFLATLFGGKAERTIDGKKSLYTEVSSFEVIQRDIQSGTGTATAHLAPASSHTTAIGTTVTDDVTALYGSLTLAYQYEPISLNEWIHAGPNSKHPKIQQACDNIANNMTRAILTGLLSDGSGTNPDGFSKWLSATATKWGLNTTTAGNYYFRGHQMTPAIGNFDEDLIRTYITLCATGDITEGGVHYYSNSSDDAMIGILDHALFNKLQKLVSDRQNIEMTRTQELAKIGGYFRQGITIDQCTFFPDLMMDELKQTNRSEGEMMILIPNDWELIMLKGFAFDFVTNPGSEDYAAISQKFEVLDYANVVWGKYVKNLALYNWFCGHPRNQLSASFTA